MNKYYKVSPSIPGCIYNKKSEYKILENGGKLITIPHLIMDYWSGDDLLSCDNFYFVSESLLYEFQKNDITGIKKYEKLNIELSTAKNTKNTDCNSSPILYSNTIPQFYYLELFETQDYKYDFFWYPQDEIPLRVSKKFLEIIKKFSHKEIEIELVGEKNED